MQLRNGKQVDMTAPPFAATIRNLLDECLNISAIDKLKAIHKVFTAINQQSTETLTGMGNNHIFISTIYRKTVELTCVLIERSYNKNTHSDDEKREIIRLLSEMFQVRQIIAQILWNARTDKKIQDMMEKGDGHSELLYRCLKHIASDESESYDYEMYLYDDGEYTDVELYDWYLLPNYYGNELTTTDSYIKNADICFGDYIRRFNEMLWH